MTFLEIELYISVFSASAACWHTFDMFSHPIKWRENVLCLEMQRHSSGEFLQQPLLQHRTIFLGHSNSQSGSEQEWVFKSGQFGSLNISFFCFIPFRYELYLSLHLSILTESFYMFLLLFWHYIRYVSKLMRLWFCKSWCYRFQLYIHPGLFWKR